MSRFGGRPEVVLHEGNGLLTEPNNVKELAQSIERLATDWSLAKAMGETGRQLAIEQYAFPHHMDRLMQLYQRVVKFQPSSLSVDLLADEDSTDHSPLS